MEVYTGIYWYILSYTIVQDSRLGCHGGGGGRLEALKIGDQPAALSLVLIHLEPCTI